MGTFDVSNYNVENNDENILTKYVDGALEYYITLIN